MNASPHQRAFFQKGSALIICLILIVMVTILVVGLTTTARIEQVTTASYAAGQESVLYARMGRDVVRARLLEATTDPAIPWVSGPGRILRYEEPSDPNAAPVEVPLFSGVADSVEKDISVNLNPPALTRAAGIVTGDSSQVMAQKWVYVRKDGTLSVTGTDVPAYSATNPVVGRFAFWADDASSRVNLNTAWTRRSANAAVSAHPSRVSLEGDAVIDAAAADILAGFRVSHPALVTAEEARSVGNAEVTEAVDTAPAAFTSYNHSSLLSPFGEPRLFLTTQVNRLGSGESNFFDILKTANSDPARLASLDNSKVQALFRRIYVQLSRKDWPVLPGKSFVDKYGARGTAQIILNLIDYVRSADSPTVVVEPIRGDFNATAGTLTLGEYAAANTLMGNSRRPVITEFGALVPATGRIEGEGDDAKMYYDCQIFIEIHLPASAGASINLVTGRYKIYSINPLGPGSADDRFITAAMVRGGNAAMNPGDYRTIVFTYPVAPGGIAAPPPTELQFRFALSQQPLGYGSPIRLDIAPLASTPTIKYAVVPGALEAAMQTFAIDDPHVKNNVGDWKLGAPTLGAAPANRALGTAAGGSLTQDHDGSGNITNHSVVFPAPGSFVTSTGDLGRIHTGVTNTTGAGTPWRTLRLQPSGTTKTNLPDWAMMELFATPMGAVTPGSLVYPVAATANGYEARGGLVNLNSTLYPFVDGDQNPLIRPIPHRALLNQAGTLSAPLIGTLAGNIADRTVAANGVLYGSNELYVAPGEIFEIAGIADSGEASEDAARAFVEQTTARSNTFLIYSVGEKIQQLPSGKIVPQGARRYVALVEKSGNEVKVVYEAELGL